MQALTEAQKARHATKASLSAFDDLRLLPHNY